MVEIIPTQHASAQEQPMPLPFRFSVIFHMALSAMACSSSALPTTPPWVDGGLTLRLVSNVPDSNHYVDAQFENRTGAPIKFGPPGCGTIQEWRDGEWQTLPRSDSCLAVIISLDDGKNFEFVFGVPAMPGMYRLVTGAVDSHDVRLTVSSGPVVVQ